MKKIYVFLVVFIAFVMGINTKSYAYNFTGHSEFDSCKGQSYYFTVNAASSTLSVVTYFGDGTNSPGTLSGTSGYSFHIYSLPGIYTIKHVLKVSSVPVDSIIFSDTVMCQNGYITAYLDVNSNCAWDPSEPFLSTPVDVEIDSAGFKIDTMSITGGGYRAMTAGKSYSIKILNLPSSLSVTCPSGGVRTLTVGSSGPTIYSFGLQCGSSSSFDLAENVSVRAGRHSEIADIIVTNTQCTPTTATLTANLSPKYGTLMYAYPTPTSVSGNTIVWTLPNVSAFANYHIFVHFERSGSSTTWLTPGDTIQTSFYLTPTAGDMNTSNNTVIRVDTVKSSFDPNDKTVYPSGNILPGAPLEYSIEFENDGNAAAKNIFILDTLSNNIDINSIKTVASSAPIMNSSLIQSGGYNILRFDMPGINLPDSSQHGQCTGMVVFTANAKTGLQQGTVITNRAGIYFDDNPVVMTGSTLNTISGMGVSKVSTDVLNVYPNPVHDILNIKTNGNYQSVQIINTLGQVMIEKNIVGKTSIDVSSLNNGIYYLILKGTNGTSAAKIEKQ
ncbi:MAG: T9SS type A sorting domain-containing protein [Bacteroidetes bacterium]|nr:T9SS type A sorting domain-containing protein [Bacteroidota bacterium]